jgi:hypothetical protein
MERLSLTLTSLKRKFSFSEPQAVSQRIYKDSSVLCPRFNEDIRLNYLYIYSTDLLDPLNKTPIFLEISEITYKKIKFPLLYPLWGCGAGPYGAWEISRIVE